MRTSQSTSEPYTTVTSTTTSIHKQCEHKGWYHNVYFYCFVRKFLACKKCGELIPQTKWRFMI